MPPKRRSILPKESYLQTQFIKTIEPYLSLTETPMLQSKAQTLKPFFIQFRSQLSKSV
jgi:hypothetical protein